MSFGFSKPLAINGMTNLWTALLAAGYTGHPVLEKDSTLQNMDAAVDCYIHFNNNRNVAPTTGTDGIPFGPVLGLSSAFVLQKRTDLSTTWLYSASAITVNAGLQP